jgi:hypothetical protein
MSSALAKQSVCGDLPPMAWKLRVQYPGAIYHIMNRGDHSESIFRDDGNPGLFVATLAEACGKAECQVHSFCPMSNPPAGRVCGIPTDSPAGPEQFAARMEARRRNLQFLP